MQALLSSGYEERLQLIYIDPPFSTNEDYYANLDIGKHEIRKSPSIIERLAYKDYWGSGIDSYLDMLYPRLQLMRLLLSDQGLIFVHLDWHVAHYAKVLLDEVFRKNFVNEIVWKRTRALHSDARRFGNVHDTIFVYSKSESHEFNPQYVPLKPEYRTRFNQTDEKGGHYRLIPAHAAGSGPPRKFGERLLSPPPGRHWTYSQDRLDEMIASGLIEYTSTGMPNVRQYLTDESAAIVQDWWDDIAPINPVAFEKLGYPTQKPQALLERIVGAASKQGELVADFFCGSGTTLAVAEKLNRSWVGCDFSKVAIQMTRNRLVDQGSTPFLVENIGNYQRQLIYLTGSRIYEIQAVVLKLYSATPRKDFPDLGVKREADVDELVFVSYPDRPVSAKKVEELAAMADKLDGRGYDRLVVLGWDYEYNFDEILEERKRVSKRRWRVEVTPKMIPPEVYEYLKRAKAEEDVEPLIGKIRFHDKPFLKLLPPELKTHSEGVEVTIGIDRYVVFDYPIENQDQRKQIDEIVGQDPLALVDYWAVDWDYDGLTFKSGWQAIRQHGRKIATVPRTTTQNLQAGRKRDIAVRVVDVFGNDASKTLSVDLRC